MYLFLPELERKELLNKTPSNEKYIDAPGVVERRRIGVRTSFGLPAADMATAKIEINGGAWRVRTRLGV